MKNKKHPHQQAEETDRDADQQAEYDAVIAPDPLLAEVGQANERIHAPDEAKRVVLSKPCEDQALDEGGDHHMTTAKQRSAAKRNVKKAATAAKRKQTLTHLPKRTRRALGQQGAASRRRAA